MLVMSAHRLISYINFNACVVASWLFLVLSGVAGVCGCFVVVSGSLSGFALSQQESRCRPPLVDTDFESVGWGGGAMEPGTLRTQS